MRHQQTWGEKVIEGIEVIGCVAGMLAMIVGGVWGLCWLAVAVGGQ